MQFRRSLLLVLITAIGVGCQRSQVSPPNQPVRDTVPGSLLSQHLQPFAPYVGRTWRGEQIGSTSDNPVIDISRWEAVLGGQAVRTVHSINDGQYGGESIIMWDANRQSLIGWYFTTAGFFTQATMKYEQGAWISHEQVTGNQNGITEVRSISRIRPDGTMHVKSEYLQNGQWVDGRDFIYTEMPSGVVRLDQTP